MLTDREAENLRIKLWKEENRDKVLEQKKRYREKNKERLKEARRAEDKRYRERKKAGVTKKHEPRDIEDIKRVLTDHQSTKDEQQEHIKKQRAESVLEKYNRVHSDYYKAREYMFKAHGEPVSCGICEQEISGGSAHWDHDHKLESAGYHPDLQFRGWLCKRCNVALGLLGDSSGMIMKAASYLAKHEARRNELLREKAA